MSLKTRLSKLEGPSATLPPVDVSIHTFFVRGENGPEETGEALARFAGASLPMLKKSLSETKEDFDARVAIFVERIKDMKKAGGDVTSGAEKDSLEAEIIAANEVASACQFASTDFEGGRRSFQLSVHLQESHNAA